VGGIAAAELAAVRGRLEAFVDDIFESLPRRISGPAGRAICVG
jgi:hypothetical protein